MPIERVHAAMTRWNLLLLGLCLATASLALALARAASTPEVGRFDRATVDVVLFDAEGVPVFATNATEAARLAQSTGSPSLLGAHHPAFGSVAVAPRGHSGVPGDLTVLFASTLVGHRAGDHYSAQTLARPFGGWSSVDPMPRRAGPFPWNVTVDRALFARDFPTAGIGDVVHLVNGAEANATVLARTESTVTYRPLLSPGDVVLVAKIGLTAVVEPSGPDAYSLRFEAEPGYAFAVRGTCGPPFYSLATGSYRIEAANESSFTLVHNANPYPELVGKDLFADVHVLAVDKLADLPLAGAWTRAGGSA